MSFKTALQRDLDRLFAKLLDSDFSIREVSKGALTQARAKLNPWAFQRLNEVSSDAFYQDVPFYYTWYGMRLLAVDGTRVALPNHRSIVEEFGVHGFGPNADSHKSLAMCSLLYDVLNCVTLDSQMAAYASSERDLLMMHLDRVKPGDLLLLDRGYPSFWLLFLLAAKGVEFCVRLQESWWLDARALINDDVDEKTVEYRLPSKDRDKLSQYPEFVDKVLKFRLIKVKLENGETEILCTSLLDAEKYQTEEFAKLYNYRWCEEEAYKMLKSRMELEKFSGKTAKAVRQDFHAKALLMTLCAVYSHPIEEKVKKEYQADQNRKRSQKINRTNAVASLMDMLVPMFLKKKYRQAIEAFDLLVYKTREIIRPNRIVERRKRPKKPHYMNYKPI